VNTTVCTEDRFCRPDTFRMVPYTRENVDGVRVQSLRLVCDPLHYGVNVPPAQVREPQAPAGIPREAYFDVLLA
jgi:hypothetical protein